MVGLTAAEAEKRLESDGLNCLADKKKTGAFKIFLGQFRDVMVMILLAATGISVWLGEVYDAVTIILIVLLNAVLGFIQEYRTEKTLETLKNMTSPTAKVYRDGKLCVISAEKIVAGDIIELDTGDKVPADCVVIDETGLCADESILTGETEAVSKHSGDLNEKDNSLNRTDIVYGGTVIVKGHAKAKVIASGGNTQMGMISGMISEIQENQTPLQKRLGELGTVVALICIAVCIIVFLAGVLRGEPVFDMLMTGITISIAAIPEGLPATVTIALALAVNRMMKQNALVNKLHSVETLGCASVICTDKTGTITENKMTVAKVFCDMREFSVSGNGYRIAGDIKYQDSAVNPMSTKSLSEILKCCVLCNNAVISSEHEVSSRERGSLKNNGFWKAVGDPTETALLVMSAKGNVTADKLKYDYIRINEIPFDSQSRCMTVIVSEKSGQKTAFSKGASDVILEKCSFIYTDNGIIPLTSSVKRQIQNKVDEMSENALRVLAFAEKTSYQNGEPSGMIFLGLTGMIDPLREEAKIAVRKCTKAHIRTVMITGDHKNTAAAIARQAGILKGKKIMTGEELNRLSDEELLECIDDISVFARVEPCHKLRLVKAYKKKGHIVTMTGDGVNDAPAIKEADVGVAMGITGTDVTKQSADIILLDDNFATLVQAVEQGRGIYANIRKFVRYLLSCNIGEVITMFAGILMGLPLVMLPVQLLLVNLITDGLPAIALGMEPTDSRVMNRPPRKSDESFFSDGLMFRIVFRGIMIGLCTLGCFTAIIGTGADIAAARTCALLTLVMSQLIHVFECKSEKGNIFTVPYFNNKKLLLAVLFSSAIIVSAIWFPPLQAIFATAALSGKEVLVSLAFSFAIPLINCIFYHGD